MESFANKAENQDAAWQRVAEAMRQGDFEAAEKIWREILAADPDDLAALVFLGTRALHTGRLKESLELGERACSIAPDYSGPQIVLGRALLASGECERALAHIERALELEPNNLTPLLCKSMALERLGRLDEAAGALHTAFVEGHLRDDPAALDGLAPNQRKLAQDGLALARTLRHDLVEKNLAPLREAYGEKALERIEKCAAIYLEETPADYPHPQQYPMFLFVPDLPAQPFYENHSEFPWLEELEAATEDIREELIRVMREDEAGFHPVVSGYTGAAGNYWEEVNNSMNWNGLYFYRHGERRDENCARCPKTAALLDRLPLVHEPGHSPEAHFSVLQPGAHIPIHTGVVNARIVVHLPLVIPPDCGIRIAGEVHGWEEGKALVFDDTFEHEAWNGSDATRVVLILDTWNPHLGEAERKGFSTLVQTIAHTPLLAHKPGAQSDESGRFA